MSQKNYKELYEEQLQLRKDDQAALDLILKGVNKKFAQIENLCEGVNSDEAFEMALRIKGIIHSKLEGLE